MHHLLLCCWSKIKFPRSADAPLFELCYIFRFLANETKTDILRKIIIITNFLREAIFNAYYFWYNVAKMLRQSFTDFIFAMNTDGSGKAASYVRALDMLGPILTALSESDRRRHHVARLLACGHPRLARMDMRRNEEGRGKLFVGGFRIAA